MIRYESLTVTEELTLWSADLAHVIKKYIKRKIKLKQTKTSAH